MEYRPPSFMKPREYEAIPGSIDALFDTYQRNKLMQRQNLMQDTQLAQQGIDPAALRANPNAEWLRIFQDTKAKRDRDIKVQDAEIASKNANTKESLARAGYYDRMPQDRVGTQAQQKAKEKNTALDTTFNLYETARDGLLGGLEGTTTGPFMGRLPAFTAKQQIAQGGVAAMAPVLKQLFRVAGEGTFTDRDQALLLDMVPTRVDHPEAIREKTKNIDNIVRAKLGRTASPTQMPDGKIRVSNGQETLLIDPADEADAAKEGYRRMP